MNDESSLQRLFGTRTDVVQETLATFGFPGDAYLPAVCDESMGENGPFLLRNEFHEVLLDLHRIRMRGESQASGDACDVSVDHDAHRQIEGVAENDVRRLAAHAG